MNLPCSSWTKKYRLCSYKLRSFANISDADQKILIFSADKKSTNDFIHILIWNQPILTQIHFNHNYEINGKLECSL